MPHGQGSRVFLVGSRNQREMEGEHKGEQGMTACVWQLQYELAKKEHLLE